ncbi:hypothetical protein ACHQM5_028892 [Ranunculus cassubicifolius]
MGNFYPTLMVFTIVSIFLAVNVKVAMVKADTCIQQIPNYLPTTDKECFDKCFLLHPDQNTWGYCIRDANGAILSCECQFPC